MRRGGIVLAGMVLLAGLLHAAPIEGAGKKTLKVTKFTDDPPNGCSKRDCSLREAIIKSNKTKRVEKIRLRPGTYTLTIPGLDENAAATGDLDITRPVKINGSPEPAPTVISQNAAPDDRVIHVLGKGKLTMFGVNVTGGTVFAGGGGILAEAGNSVSLSSGAVSLNNAGQQGGGGILAHGPLTVSNSFIQFNGTTGGGGGIAAESTTAIVGSHINANTAQGTAGNGGGGIFQFGGALLLSDSQLDGNLTGGNGGGGVNVVPGLGRNPSFTMVRSTAKDNESTNDGGGIRIQRVLNAGFGDAPFFIDDSTFSGNEADGIGGGIACHCTVGGDITAPASIAHSTIVGNTADRDSDDDLQFGDAATEGEGGGFGGSGIQPDVLATIIGDNNDPGDELTDDEDCGGHAMNSLGSNVTTEPDPGFGAPNRGCFYPAAPIASDVIVGQLDFMGPLQNNGGPTETHAIVATATAQDRHVGAGCSGTDQRGVPRPAGAGCDSGAYEIAECGGVLVNVVGTSGSDVLVGTPVADGILGLDGNDRLFGLDGNDGLCGDRGKDRLDGGPGIDVCDGGPKKDRLANCP